MFDISSYLDACKVPIDQVALIQKVGEAMCLWAVRHVRFERLSGKQKTGLKRKLQDRKKVVQSQLRDVNAALKHVARHSRGKPARRRGR